MIPRRLPPLEYGEDPQSDHGEPPAPWEQIVEAVRFEVFQRLAALTPLRPAIGEPPVKPRTSETVLAYLHAGIEHLQLAEKEALCFVPRKLQRKAWQQNLTGGGGWEEIAAENPAALRLLRITIVRAFAERLMYELTSEGRSLQPWPKLPPHRNSDDAE